MKKDKDLNKDYYEGKISKKDRILLLTIGIFNFPVGLALYFFFNEKKDKEYYSKFAYEGAIAGIYLTVLFILTAIICYLYFVTL